MDEMEEIGQELDRTLRVALTGAGQLAERVSRRMSMAKWKSPLVAN